MYYDNNNSSYASIVYNTNILLDSINKYVKCIQNTRQDNIQLFLHVDKNTINKLKLQLDIINNIILNNEINKK